MDVEKNNTLTRKALFESYIDVSKRLNKAIRLMTDMSATAFVREWDCEALYRINEFLKEAELEVSE